MFEARERLHARIEHRTPAHTPSSPPRRLPAVPLWGLALGLAMLGGAGCRTDLGRATFCHSLTVDGQPAVLKLLEELDNQVEETFTAKTGECSPCSEITVGSTFDLEVHDPTDNLIAKRYLYLHPNIHTYLLSVHSNPDGTHVLDVMSYGSNVSCKQVRAAALTGTPIQLRANSEGDEDASLLPPADPSETAASP